MITQKTASQISLRNYSKEGKGGALLYMNFFFPWEKDTVKHIKITANHKEQTFQVNDFSGFTCKNLGVTENFP